ncbi:uncharacterized protein [Epargyreus clarus]|uniref:uncharacterized protein isoform X4 n=1 Tax=Epargyreus clarus TaxID=520877 RepID=UPI003C2FF785
MSLASKGNKENFRLLDLSSDEESEDLQLEIIPNRKKKITRKERNRGSQPRTPEPSFGAEVQCALCWAVRGTLVLWLLMLTWLCAALYDQVSTMRYDITSVSTSSASVGDAIQICHMTSKELSANTTELSARLSKLELQYQELSKNMEQATKDLTSVMDQLAAAPKFADMPKRLGELQITVADFGSKMQDFERLLQTTKTQAAATSTGVDDIKAILHELEVRTNDTIANVTNSMKQEDDLKGQVASLNDTLVSRVDALQMKIEQINKQMSTPAPPTPAPLTSSTVSSTTAVNNATAAPPPPAPPANKPNVLQ